MEQDSEEMYRNYKSIDSVQKNPIYEDHMMPDIQQIPTICHMYYSLKIPSRDQKRPAWPAFDTGKWFIL